ncbi:acetyltransferase [Chryseobacterium sp. JJR-5R]|uniref:acetyltransferase n=1 Tax=Chryseobacterium sp. JJR-5R TaxID=3093923 RepID=UPI002A75956A|nr:acetyltransferase [Chryseobacterium sp. JJR-5R]WPO82006.1 acetyltransferase [Chryseobacterium sp. JJR-5R]
MKKIAIIGAGGFGREVKMLIDQINEVTPGYEIIGFYDDKEHAEIINGIPYLGQVENVNEINDPVCLAVAIGDPFTKKKVIGKITNQNIEYPNLIHPSVIIGKDNVSFGKGNIICAGVIITVDIEIEDFVILNLSCTLGHDTKIKSFSSFMPTVNISGEVMINESVYVGTGAKIINLLEIGENTVVGAGAVVAKSLPANCTAVGIPAKPIKFHE